MRDRTCLVMFGYNGSERLCDRHSGHEDVIGHKGPLMGSYACEVLIELRKLRNALHSDRFLDLVLDELTERAGHDRNTDALGLARWDLKAAIWLALEDRHVF